MIYLIFMKKITKSILESVHKNLHPLNKAINLQKKASSVGFDWSDRKAVLLKIKEEVEELFKEFDSENQNKIFEETGDILFSVINLIRFLNIDIEKLLNQANNKFIQRFKKMEIELQKQNLNIKNVSIDKMGKIWKTIS